MRKLEDLVCLEKKSEVKICCCDFISDFTDEESNARYRILKDGERYFFHYMKDGEVVECYELALSWKPMGEFYVFIYTPDDRHIYEIDSRFPKMRTIYKLNEDQIQCGDFVSFGGHRLEYVNENYICFDGKRIFVERNDVYLYKILKTKVKAIDGARGLYIFLENIAETGKVEKFPLFCNVWEAIAEKYNPCR